LKIFAKVVENLQILRTKTEEKNYALMLYMRNYSRDRWWTDEDKKMLLDEKIHEKF
jgi:hypothetical protein